jgi:hypothetical protein
LSGLTEAGEQTASGDRAMVEQVTALIAGRASALLRSVV